MRHSITVIGFSCIFLLLGRTGFAQKSSEKPAQDQARPSASEAESAEPADSQPSRRMHGAVERPSEGLKHPDLDKAWDIYNSAVAKTAEKMRQLIAEQFELATAAGNLTSAERWEAARKRFEESGSWPSEPATKELEKSLIGELREARNQLQQSYARVVKALTIAKNLGDARTCRDESNELFRSSSPADDAAADVATGPGGGKKTPSIPTAPRIAGTWRDNAGTLVTVAQKGEFVAYAGADSSFNYQINCKWDGSQFVGVNIRTNRANGCATRLKTVLTLQTPTALRIDESAMDENCDVKMSHKASFGWTLVRPDR